MDMEIVKINLCYCDLVTYIVKKCFYPFSVAMFQNEREEQKKMRCIFADSYLLELWCDCVDNFNYKKIRKEILKHNGQKTEKEILFELKESKKNADLLRKKREGMTDNEKYMERLKMFKE